MSLNNYYLNKKEWPKALQANDSLIKFAHIIAPYNIAGLNKTNSFIYEQMGQTEDALESLKIAFSARDSIETLDANKQLNELQVKYDLNQLNYDKSQLEIKNKMIFIICLLVVLLLFVALCVYLYRNLKREQDMKTRLRVLMKRAEESDQMKSKFINSICHEIRTPLNAISGFSGLIFDPSVDDDMKQRFPAEIQYNTKLLTSLIDCMLEVSHLDVSDEKLPCEDTDIAQICHGIIDLSMESLHDGVEFKVEMDRGPIIISTNAHYLSLVLDNLISNACKFTEKGSIAISCMLKDNLFILSVTDTGCGIPENMHEAVFNRFIKLDSYKQGNGLGLYLCKLIVVRLLGKIYVDPSYKDGTRIIVELPLD